MTVHELLPLVQAQYDADQSILECLSAFEGEPSLPGLGWCIAEVYKSVRWGEANFIVSSNFEANFRPRDLPRAMGERLTAISRAKPSAR